MEEIDERECVNRVVLESGYIDYFTQEIMIDAIYNFFLICGYRPGKKDIADIINQKDKELTD